MADFSLEIIQVRRQLSNIFRVLKEKNHVGKHWIFYLFIIYILKKIIGYLNKKINNVVWDL